ncbi:glycerophosphodiester phosphodiesterase family protein [Sphingomicrobium clamense]|uniref:Glycerophosphodiester phosphodiesterase n=1 Tax=Sphingomicrobium clamense TaxID=2851013 RepID=A0ABS6V2R5_9SPHN|nr:glycerophosphodiester phosphodiesterase family protein [Sphingomicrobium sp. B8]MBW0143850.1 glycerophosphodiester phosphodiesterase [Sphingomicrobium sp. B8]
MGFAHRGLHDDRIPENSLASFEAAMALGAGIESDLQLSGCGTAMVFHDRDGQRLCGQRAAVGDSDVATMRDWRLKGTDQAPHTLADMLDLVAGRVPLLLEMKEEHRNGERIAAATLAALHGYDGPVGVMSFSARAMRFVRKTAPDVRRGLVFSGRDVALRRFDKLQRAQPDFIAAKVTVIHKAWARALRGRMPLYSWTARTPADAAKVAKCADAPIWEGDGRPRP